MNSTLLSGLGIQNAIDTHLHPWSLQNLPPIIEAAKSVRPDLAHDFSPAWVVETAQEFGIAQVILVQVRDVHENALAEAHYFAESAAANPAIKAGVVGIDLSDPRSSEKLISQYIKLPVVRGVRMIKPENLGVGIYSDPAAKTVASMLGEVGLRLDLLIRCRNPGQLQEGVSFVQWLAQHSKTIVVGDHLLKPIGLSEGKPHSDWLSALRQLAECPNFYLKISGLPGEVPQGSSFDVFLPFYEAALEILGPNRLLFGSDHPVSFGYAGCVQAVVDWITQNNHRQYAQKIFSDNARQAYGI